MITRQRPDTDRQTGKQRWGRGGGGGGGGGQEDIQTQTGRMAGRRIEET